MKCYGVFVKGWSVEYKCTFKKYSGGPCLRAPYQCACNSTHLNTSWNPPPPPLANPAYTCPRNPQAP